MSLDQVRRVAPELPSGVKKQVLREAPKENWRHPVPGDKVTVHYTGRLEASGEEFDTSKGKDPAVFDIGKGEVIKGWEAAIPTMRQGEEARFTIAPEMAYGSQGLEPKIPPNATLIFDVTLVSFESKDNLFGDWACIRTVLQEGQGFGCLTEGSEVEISIRAAAEDGRTLEERRSTPYKIGSGTLGDLSRVADKALEDMKKGSLVELRCEPQYAYGNTSHGEVTIRLEVHEVYMEEDVTPEKTGEVKKKQIKEGIGNDSPRDTAQVNLTVEVVRDSGGAVITCVGGPSEITFRAGDGQVCDALELAVLRMNQGERAMIYCNKPSMCTDPGLKLSLTEGEAIFTIELTSFQNPRNTYDMPEADKLKHAMERKETGSRLFREQRYFLALQRYRGVLDFFSFCENFSEAMKAQVKDLKKTCELNLSQCLLKLGDFYGAKVACDNVLSEEPHNLKALFRRASANLQRHDFSESLNDLKQLLELEPNNTEARRLLPQAQRGAKEGEKKARSMYAKMTKSLGTGREEVKGLQFNFEPKPEGFPALYLDAPGRNTASCNAGDYRLYVGGGAINRAFGDLFKKHQGLQFDKVCEEYKQMHLELLQASRKAGRKLVSAKDLPNAAALLPKLRLCASFGRAADVLPEEVQQNGDQQDLHELAGSTGSVFIDIFEEEQRPLSSRNVAMLYVVGPKGEGCVGPGEHAGPLLDEDRFLEMLENLATKAIETVAEYNDIRETACGSFVGPPIEEVRWCLVSGGVYRHANVSKVDVARITIIGMRAARGADGLVVTFAYDEDVFKKAWEIENKSSR